MRLRLFIVILLFGLAVFASGCDGDEQILSLPAVSAPQSTHTPAPTPTRFVPTPTLDPYKDWLTYTHPEYAFSFLYPAEWQVELSKLETDKGYLLDKLTLRAESSSLYFLLSTDPQILQSDGYVLGEGELSLLTQVDLNGKALDVYQLVNADLTDKLFLSEPLTLLDFENFSMLGYAAGQDMTEGIPQSKIEQVLKVLDSLNVDAQAFVTPAAFPGWVEYTNPDFGFSLWHPEDWELLESGVEQSGSQIRILQLKKDNLLLNIEYWFTENYSAHLYPYKAGLLQEDGFTWFLGQKISRLDLVQDEKTKAVFYNDLNNLEIEGRSFRLYLSDAISLLHFKHFDVDDGLQTEAETILKTFQLSESLLQPKEISVSSQGHDRFLTFGDCFDLDGGIQVDLEDERCDFTIEQISRESQKIRFQPQLNARFGFSSGFGGQPHINDCMSLETLSSSEETIAPLTSHYICYQTNTGYYGSLLFNGLTSDGVTFSWETSDVAGLMQESDVPRYEAAFLSDVSVSDGTVFAPGEAFTKTWLIMNTGETVWEEDFAIRFRGGERMDAPFEAYLPHKVNPNGQVYISIDLIAPQAPGVYESHWQFRDINGVPFGLGSAGDLTFYTSIVVEAGEEPLDEDAQISVDSPVIYARLDEAVYKAECPGWMTISGEIWLQGSDTFSWQLAADAQSASLMQLPDIQSMMFPDSGSQQAGFDVSILVFGFTGGQPAVAGQLAGIVHFRRNSCPDRVSIVKVKGSMKCRN